METFWKLDLGNVLTVITLLIAALSAFFKLRSSSQEMHTENRIEIGSIKSIIGRVERKIDDNTEETRQVNKAVSSLTGEFSAHTATDKLQFEHLNETLRNRKDH